jgi:hypothetical protein
VKGFCSWYIDGFLTIFLCPCRPIHKFIEGSHSYLQGNSIKLPSADPQCCNTLFLFFFSFLAAYPFCSATGWLLVITNIVPLQMSAHWANFEEWFHNQWLLYHYLLDTIVITLLDVTKHNEMYFISVYMDNWYLNVGNINHKKLACWR